MFKISPDSATAPAIPVSRGIRIVCVPVATRDHAASCLRAALAERLHLSANRGGDGLGLHDRQRRCLLSAAEATNRAAELLAGARDIADVAELAAIELRQGLAQLGMISGQTATEDILGRIFARFCVGK